MEFKIYKTVTEVVYSEEIVELERELEGSRLAWSQTVRYLRGKIIITQIGQ